MSRFERWMAAFSDWLDGAVNATVHYVGAGWDIMGVNIALGIMVLGTTFLTPWLAPRAQFSPKSPFEWVWFTCSCACYVALTIPPALFLLGFIFGPTLYLK
jgi:hypothetical protein